MCIGKHRKYSHLGQPEELALAEHALVNEDHAILLGETQILAPSEFILFLDIIYIKKKRFLNMQTTLIEVVKT